MTLPVSSRIASAALHRAQHQREVLNVASRAASMMDFSTFSPRNVWMNGSDDPEHDTAPSRSRHYHSMDESRYNAGWRNAMQQTASTTRPATDGTGGWTGAANAQAKSSLDEFDPILSIRALNPLIFESNYDLEEYGPSFREDSDKHESVIQEWRIRNESMA